MRDRIKSDRGRIRKLGADYLAYALLDAIVENYFIILEKMGEEIESLEEELLTDPSLETLHAIHNLKRKMMLIQRGRK